MVLCQALRLHRGSTICTRKVPLAHIIRFVSNYKMQSTTNIFEPIPKEELVTKFKTKLRDREFTPGSSEGGFPEFLAEPRDSFPLGVRVQNPNHASLAELTARCMEFVEENHPKTPAILFRGLPAKTADDFSTIANEIPWKPLVYEGGSAFRTQVDKNAKTYTASEDPMEVTIDMHNEMSYLGSYPKKLFFYCLKEADDGCGGETPLVKNSELLSKLDPEVVRKFEEKQVRYVRYMPDKSHDDYMNWQHLFTTESKEEAEKKALEKGYHVTWNSTQDLFLWQNRSVCIRHPLTGSKIWFNQATAMHSSYYQAMPTFIGKGIPDDKCPSTTCYGDGSAIEPEVIQHIRATFWACAVGFQWRPGDLLALDNLAVQHGRIGWTGERKILAYLTF
ncbi:dapdiamide synthesis protein DdaC-like [Oculina patagonica]